MIFTAISAIGWMFAIFLLGKMSGKNEIISAVCDILWQIVMAIFIGASAGAGISYYISYILGNIL